MCDRVSRGHRQAPSRAVPCLDDAGRAERFVAAIIAHRDELDDLGRAA